MKIIGAIGENGSGKDEILSYLKSKYNIPFIGTGDIVRSIAQKEGVEPTRSNLGEISSKYFRQFGKGYFVKLAAEQVEKNRWEVAGISGIRSLEDVTILKDMLGDNFILVRVMITDPKERYRRMLNRGSDRDPDTFEKFLQLDENEEKIFHLEEASRQASFTLTNDGSLEDLHNKIDVLVKQINIYAG